jgi:single-stranded DNA-specific DHH superfamily exonuclease
MSINSKKKRDLKKKKAPKSKQSESVSIKQMRAVSDRYSDILQNIEMILVTASRENNAVTDCEAADALRAILFNKANIDPLAQKIAEDLRAVRELRTEISDAVWKSCLRVVLDSVHTHSTLTPGAKGYLNFVSDFL